MIGNVAQALFYILPNLQNFSLKSQILDSLPNDPPTDILIPWLISYSIIYAITGWLIAYLIFFRKEL